jgi:Zn-dependent protease with chaperone function
VVADPNWNASNSAVGWRRRRVVTLGLPLWDALPADQKVAVLGHELAHGVNGDARHGVVVGTSLATLARLRLLLRPGPRLHRSRGRVALVEALLPLVAAPLRALVSGLLMAQLLITLRSHQRAEYLADVMAARVASPASVAAALDTILTGQATHSWVLDRRKFTAGTAPFWDQLRSALAAIPETEKDRRRWVSARERLRVNTTHPPAHLRVKLVQALPPGQPAVTLSAEQEAQIRAELAPDYTRVAAQIDDALGVASW